MREVQQFKTAEITGKQFASRAREPPSERQIKKYGRMPASGEFGVRVAVVKWRHVCVAAVSWYFRQALLAFSRPRRVAPS